MFEQQPRRIPTLLALLILLFGVGGGVFLAESTLKFISKAAPQIEPQDIRVTNRTSSMATVSWITTEKVWGAIWYGKQGEKMKQLAVDDRRKEGKEELFTTHHVTLRNLLPATKYNFIIQTGKKKYDNKGKPFSFSTFPAAKLGNLTPAYGEVFLPNDNPAGGAIVYLTVEGAEPLSTLVKSSGVWLIPLNLAYDKNSASPLEKLGDRKIELFIRSPSLTVAQAITDAEHFRPVPTIIIGKRYDFRLRAEQFLGRTQVLGEETSQQKKIYFTIIQPQEQQAISSPRPLIRGKGIPGESITVILESAGQPVVVKVDKRGNWSWTPPLKLLPGVYRVRAIALDRQGKRLELVRNFSILPLGSSILGEATPSATIAPTVSPPPTVTPAPLTPTITPQISPTPIFTLPTLTPTIPPNLRTGTIFPTLVLVVLGMLLVFTGLHISFSKY